MRISIEINAEKELRLPVHYNHILQGFLYQNLSADLSKEFALITDTKARVGFLS
jgi:CRISPR-associated endoribonuclease Cas6